MEYTLLGAYQSGLRAIGAVAFAIAGLLIWGMLAGQPRHVIVPTLVAEAVCLAIGTLCAVPSMTPGWLERPETAGVGSMLAGGSLLLWFVLSTSFSIGIINIGFGPRNLDDLRIVYRALFLGIVAVGAMGAFLGARADPD